MLEKMRATGKKAMLINVGEDEGYGKKDKLDFEIILPLVCKGGYFSSVMMGAVDTELHSPLNANGFVTNLRPAWRVDNSFLELDYVGKRQPINMSSSDAGCTPRGFVMHVSDISDDSDSEEEAGSPSIMLGTRFSCDELYMSDDSGESSPGLQCQLMNKVDLAEGELCRLIDEFRLSVSEEMRNKISALEKDNAEEYEKFDYLIAKIEERRAKQQEWEREIDLQYKRATAEAFDNHLTALQMDHEKLSQLEERRIKEDAARHETKRKQKTRRQENFLLEKAKADEEIRLKAEVAKAEAEKEALEDAAAKLAAETAKHAVRKVADDSKGTMRESMSSVFDAKIEVQSRVLVKASGNALELEKRRRKIYDDLSAKHETLKASGNQDYNSHGKSISRCIRTINTEQNIRIKADELVRLMGSSGFPNSMALLLFAEKVTRNYPKRTSNTIFTTARILILMTSKIPEAMDILLAALNKVCIYTVPKHISYSQAAFATKEAYWKVVGYEEVDGKIESTDEYLEKLRSYMKLYGALVQTIEVGVENFHGPSEGWTWLARFLNNLPANLYTAVALDSFLQMAGFALYQKYKDHFEKLLTIIARDFIPSLVDNGLDANLTSAKLSLQHYLDSNLFRKETEGFQL